MLTEPTQNDREARAAMSAEHIETQHSADGTSVLVMRVIEGQSPGRVSYDVVQAAPVKRVENVATRGAAHRLARKWASESREARR